MTFHKTIVTVTVLSEAPLVYDDIGHLKRLIDWGSCVGTVEDTSREQITAKQCADALYAMGSEPGFFMLDDDGNLTEDPS